MPKNISDALRELDQDYREGDITDKGYIKKRAILLEPFRNLVSVNGTVSFGVHLDNVENGQVDGRGPVGGARRLLSFMGEEEGGVEEEERRLADVVATAKRKELNREKDMKKAREEWEKKYGAWVST